MFPNPSSNLQVIANGDMTLTISPGFAWINGYMYHNTDNLILTVDHSDSALKRVEEIVKEKKVYKIVLGYPKHMNGDVGEKALLCEDFKKHGFR